MDVSGAGEVLQASSLSVFLHKRIGGRRVPGWIPPASVYGSPCPMPICGRVGLDLQHALLLLSVIRLCPRWALLPYRTMPVTLQCLLAPCARYTPKSLPLTSLCLFPCSVQHCAK